MAALTRTMREDMRHSVRLCSIIVGIFFKIIRFNKGQYLDLLTRNRVGDLCLRALELENRRCVLWETHKPSVRLVKAQEYLLRDCICVLRCIAELSLELLTKMSRRGVVQHVLEIISKKKKSLNSSLAVTAACFLVELSRYEVLKDEISRNMEPTMTLATDSDVVRSVNFHQSTFFPKGKRKHDIYI
jgi:Kinesin-associated protein (KAP)